MELYPHQIEALELIKDKNRCAVKGYEGLYEVDNQGSVYSIVHDAHRRRRKLSAYKNGTGYLKVNLYDANGTCKKKYVHRIVAEAFIPNPDGLLEVNHIDCDKTNNCVNNLEWCDRKTNLEHSYNNSLKRCGEKHGMHKLTLEQVKLILSSDLTGKQLAKIYHVSQSTISAIKTHRNWKGVMPSEII